MAIKDFANEAEELVKSEMINILDFFGLQCVAHARDRNPEISWYDQTGNLRSSIGYKVVDNGTIVKSGGFQGEAEGSGKGESYAEKVAANVDGISLVIVAGMEYAIEVEALESKNVLASTIIWANKEWKNIEKKLQSSVEKKLNELIKKYA